ncbi:MAG: CvpA family protein [Hydrotalea sp.]|nr:CvpA family protein [Hydrotalea sp.]
MFDTLAIAVLSLFAVSGMMRGWLTVLGQMVCWFLSLLVAIMTGSYLTDYLINDVNIGHGLGAQYAGAIEIAATIFIFGLSLILTAGFVRGSAMYHRENAHIELGDKIVGLFFGAAQGAAVMIFVYALAFSLIGKKDDNFLQHATATTYLDPITRQIISNITPELSNQTRYKSLLQIFNNAPAVDKNFNKASSK